jgi:hypothetical protein
LVSSGYDAWCALYPEAESLLGTEHFDLIIISAFLTDQQKNQLVALAGTMPTIVLRGLTLAPELLRLIERRLDGGLMESDQKTGE